VQTLWRITEWLFWLLALLTLAPMAAFQWVMGKGVGSAAVYTQFLSDLGHFGRWWHAHRRMSCQRGAVSARCHPQPLPLAPPMPD
jgi:hypothetical protein